MEGAIAVGVVEAETSRPIIVEGCGTLGVRPVESEATSFTVRQLDPAKTYVLIKDGQPLGEIRKSDHTQAPGAEWQADGSVRITTALHGPHSFVLEARSANVAAH